MQAATLAAKNKNLGPQLDYGYTEEGHKEALLAATLSVRGRKRADSTPDMAIVQNDTANQKSNSLVAATLAHADGLGSRAIEQSRLIHARNLSRDMYAEHPNVDIEKKEKAHQDALKSASISMAKKMYAIERVDDHGFVRLSAGQAAARTADRSSVESANDLRQQALQYLTLQDAAQRLAAERLAKIEDQHEATAFRDYYGYSPKRRSRLTLKGRNRRRASSESAAVVGRNESLVENPPASPQPHRRNLDIDSDDEEQAARVRSQMNTFNAKLAEADKKRLRDREMLLAAAERKVQAQMSKMDEKVFNETGKMSPAMMEEWDNRARAKAAAASQMRMQNHGKVDVGGGKFLDQSEIDAIALANIKPTLDEINETAEKQRARDEEIRLEKTEQKRQVQLEKERNAESKALMKRMKGELFFSAALQSYINKSLAEDRDAERTKKRDEKIAAQQERTAAKEERQREKEAAKEERQRDKAIRRMQKDATKETFSLEEQKEKEPETPTQKKSPWKKLLPHRHAREDREPGKIGRISTGGTRDQDAAVMTQPEEEAGEEVEITATSATMAGDTPATVAAPEAAPQTNAAIDAQATTPIEERIGTFGSESRRTTAEESEEMTASAVNPSKKRFSRLIGKLKRNQKDKKDDKAEIGSFSGGAKLHKQQQIGELHPNNHITSPAVGTTLGAGEIARHASSPSVSSLSSSEDEGDQHEERGRSATRLDQVARQVADIKDSEEDTDLDFEEARDRFDESELAPPPALLSRKTTGSPVRDSKFHEVL
jgi:hypothetical protein